MSTKCAVPDPTNNVIKHVEFAAGDGIPVNVAFTQIGSAAHLAIENDDTIIEISGTLDAVKAIAAKISRVVAKG